MDLRRLAVMDGSGIEKDSRAPLGGPRAPGAYWLCGHNTDAFTDGNSLVAEPVSGCNPPEAVS